MPNDEPDAMGLGVPPPPVVFFGPLVLGLLLNSKLPAPFLPRRLSRILGLPLLSSGALLGGWFYRTMGRARTPIIGEPFVPGRPPSSLVTDGPFATPATQDTSQARLVMRASQVSRMRSGSSCSCR